MVLVFIMNRMSSSQSSVLAQRRRMALGIIILLLVDVIWVASSELTLYIFKHQDYNKPFFSTFAKTSMFVLYLLGFLVWRPWRQQCSGRLCGRPTAFFADAEAYLTTCTTDNNLSNSLSEPLYVPVKFQDAPAEQASNAKGNSERSPKKHRVRFSNIMEVRQLPSTQALEAKLSRMSYPAAKDHESMLKTVGKLTVIEVAKISFFFCFVWFLANLSYQEALSDTQVAIVNMLSSTSGLFTLILAAIFPSNSSDRFTLSKLLAVVLSIGGVALVSFSSSSGSDEEGALGILWSLAGAVLYAVYIVMIKRKFEREDRLDIPMFFGFVGLFNLLLLWPGFLLLHYAGFEPFELPSKLVWMYIIVNGLVGTVLSEFLWLWGCFLTSSLIGTLALSLTIPLSIIADMCMQKVQFSWLFFAGAIPVFLSFFIATLLSHYNNWDPVMVGLRRVFAFVCRKHRIQRLPEDSEQCESLIPLHNVLQDNGGSCS
ncbi:solute carrier family 35 member F5-like [Scleropages formosus]|uniref:Solute carrier family 35 member F5 n=1 Tax=Scleropages formosus TaxID=113540 RepID=A0A8C9V9K7_SCLFO|nr:solute carrier family 35 member F5 [Scleropages formosus]XP_018587861.1 solute carrier family 35 member F5 [Scleropages formosus]XP_018587862.1 solute carrier family 35 member F5 [Scleropages formosus]XP_029107096.1 solute carrier family 35 member F5-like [Scleropages formosus]XP_029107099.1 solute carrier family 35 member F5-like [Scleropages formosus]XP_029107107.1 solute carrier family 35 member F5-like [Scleropages formosus]